MSVLCIYAINVVTLSVTTVVFLLKYGNLTHVLTLYCHLQLSLSTGFKSTKHNSWDTRVLSCR